MTDIILNILFLSAPLLLASLGALVSEYAGRTAVFIDGMLNLSAFLCYAFTVLTKSPAAGCMLSVVCCTAFLLLFLTAVEYVHANPFLASLALNIFAGALVSLLSVEIFGTRGVLTSPHFIFRALPARYGTTITAYILAAAGILFLFTTKKGLYIRITGTNSDVLLSKGINVSGTRILSGCIAAVYTSCAGCILAIRLSSFVPNISSGQGWLALAAVFLGKRTSTGTIIAVTVMCAAEYFASNMQNVFPHISTPLLLSFPYIMAIILIFIAPGKNSKN
jgi:ABC-type uncharacterized transport system permease subunit